MNKMSEDPKPPKKEPEIILLGIDKSAFYLFKGEDYINQIMLADGEFPKPILCVHFDSVFDAKRVIGDALNIQQCWGIHPDIIQRLRDSKALVETNA
ncbi:MAG: hypothetical protein AAGA08_08270 [Pseudomonadota bacterium]